MVNPPVDAEKHVGHRTDDILAHQVFLQAINIRPKFLDHAELLFVDAGDEDMDLAAILREIGRDFIGEERAGKVGDLQRAADAVVVGDGHEVHPLLPRVAIDLLGSTNDSGVPMRRRNHSLGRSEYLL